MKKSADLGRRSFVMLGSLITAGIFAPKELLAIAKGASFTENRVYVCTPCGLDCDKLEFDKPGSCTACAMPLIEKGAAVGVLGPGSARFPEGKTAVQFPFELLANGIFFQIQVNNKGPLTFALDTGSFNSIVASEIVDELGIQTGATGKGLGSGTAFTTSQIPSLDFLLPGNLTLSTKRGAAISLGNLSALIARRFDGILGFDVLGQLVVQIDYQRRMITLHDPAHFEYKGVGTVMPFTLWSNYDPQIEGEILIADQSPMPVKIALDTGAGGSTLTTPFVKAHRLTESMKTLQSPDVGAGGGESVKWEGRGQQLRIGSLVVDRPLFALSTDTVGSLAHAEFDLNLGGNILRRFTIIIDYPGKRLILEPNSDFHKPFASDASGLVLKAEGPEHKIFIVRGVVPNSPATKAGVQVGDIITAIDGSPVRKYALWELEEELKKSGRVIDLKIKRGPTSLTSRLRLRSLL
jgi:PDZ domain/Aspartyl protease